MYEQQLARVERWYKRFSRLNRGIPHQRSHDELTDEVYAFFINCFHLKDWIRGDESLTFPNKHSVIERFITSSRYMSICADLCHGMKHLRLKRTRTGKQPHITTGHIGLGGPKPIVKMAYTIDTARGPMGAFQLATKCMRAWRRFMRKNIKRTPGVEGN
jgi:hypothetical protein